MIPSINNLYGRDGFWWWYGVVEDRDDPEKLGRCRVRILGYHIDNKEILPTVDLPWAIPVMSMANAGLSGKGMAPVGPLPGTWVVGFFADGKDCQQPVMFGTAMAREPNTRACATNNEQTTAYSDNVLKDGSGNPVRDSSGNPIKVGQDTSTTVTAVPTNNTGPLISVVGDSIAVGTGGALTKIQDGVQVLATVGHRVNQSIDAINATPSIKNPRFAVVSIGSNDIVKGKGNPSRLSTGIETIRTQLAAKAYVWILPYDSLAKSTVKAVADKYGDKTIDLDRYPTSDTIHPTSYANVAKDVKALLATIGTNVPDPNQAPKANNNLNTGVQPGSFILRDLPPLSKSDVQILMHAIGKAETGSIPGGVQNYSKENTIGYVGKYQFGAAALTSRGWLEWTTNDKGKRVAYSNKAMIAGTAPWTGKDGVRNLSDWKTNGLAQERAMFDLLETNWRFLSSKGAITPNGNKCEVAGLLHIAHLLGSGGALKYKNGINGKDAFGASGEDVYKISYEAVCSGGKTYPSLAEARAKPVVSRPPPAGEAPVANNGVQPPPNTDPAQALNDPRVGNPPAFSDPSGTYPKCDYNNHPDTNKLATGEDTNNTIVGLKNQRMINGIRIANDDDTWDEPDSPYCGRYPYNHVMESEAGHVVEIDNTPNHERIHIYHKSGTFFEIDKNGTLRQHVQGDSYEVYVRNRRLYVRGDMDVTIDGKGRILVEDALELDVWGASNINIRNNANINISGNANVSVTGDLKARAKNIDLLAEKISLESTADFNLKVGGAMNLQAAGKTSIISGNNLDITAANTNIDGGDINFNSGLASPTAASASGAGSVAVPDPAKSPASENLPDLIVNTCDPVEASLISIDTPEDAPRAQAYVDREVAKGTISPEVKSDNDALAKQGCKRSNTTKPEAKQGRPVDRNEFNSYTEFPHTLKLSRHFNLGQLTDRCPLGGRGDPKNLQPNKGLSKAQICANLKALAVNVLDPIKDRYPNMLVTNAFRAGANQAQHGNGEAADIQLQGVPASAYFDFAVWIKDNLPFDQLLIESTGPNRFWIHISYRDGANRPSSANNKVGTLIPGVKNGFKPFLCDLS
jgi:hypothetical protein